MKSKDSFIEPSYVYAPYVSLYNTINMRKEMPYVSYTYPTATYSSTSSSTIKWKKMKLSPTPKNSWTLEGYDKEDLAVLTKCSIQVRKQPSFKYMTTIDKDNKTERILLPGEFVFTKTLINFDGFKEKIANVKKVVVFKYDYDSSGKRTLKAEWKFVDVNFSLLHLSEAEGKEINTKWAIEFKG